MLKEDVLFVGHNQELIINKEAKVHLSDTKQQFSTAVWVAKLAYFLTNNKVDINKSKIGFNNYTPLYVKFADIN